MWYGLGKVLCNCFEDNDLLLDDLFNDLLLDVLFMVDEEEILIDNVVVLKKVDLVV